jgi:hypothetical protein
MAYAEDAAAVGAPTFTNPGVSVSHTQTTTFTTNS